MRFRPDGSGHFTRRMGMLVDNDHLGFGFRGWRHVMVVDDGVIEHWLEEPGINDAGSDEGSFTVTHPNVGLDYLRGEGARLRVRVSTRGWPASHQRAA